MIMNQPIEYRAASPRQLPLDSLVGELFGRASRKSHLVFVGWILALGSHAAASLLFYDYDRHDLSAAERTRPPVELEFVAPPEPPPPPPEIEQPEEPKPASPQAAAAAPPAAARAGALHLARADAAPAQQSEEAVDF